MVSSFSIAGRFLRMAVYANLRNREIEGGVPSYTSWMDDKNSKGFQKVKHLAEYLSAATEGRSGISYLSASANILACNWRIVTSAYKGRTSS
jgi:hypothetical protein